jgi:hypothetical protein
VSADPDGYALKLKEFEITTSPYKNFIYA